MQKPTLYNGFVIARKFIITRRIHIEKAFELYLLESGEILALFMNSSHDYLEDKLKLGSVKFGNLTYLYSIFDGSSPKERIAGEISNLVNPKGLSAIAGMTELKHTFLNDVIEPIKKAARYKKFEITLPNAILLFGPPGCGKTYFVKKIAEELNYYFIDTSQATFASSYIHGTSLKIKAIFDEAKSKAPSLIFIDEIDSLFPKRENIGSEQNYKHEEINEFLVQMNDCSEMNILVIGATNKPDLLDDALLRTGRMDKLIYVGLPDYDSRKSLFLFYLRKRPTHNINYDNLSRLTSNYTCSDIEYICNEASKRALSLEKDFIETDDLFQIIDKTSSSVTSNMLDKYNKFTALVRK